MEQSFQAREIREAERGRGSAGDVRNPVLDVVKQERMEKRKNSAGDVAEERSKRRKAELQRPKTEKEYIIEGRSKRRKIELQRPKTEKARVESNTAILKAYKRRYTTEVNFLEFDENGHTVWEIKTTVKGSQNKTTGTPYTSELTPETGTFTGGNYNRRHDEKLEVAGTKALFLSDVLYGQIEVAKGEIRHKASELPELEGCNIPEFDLKKHIEKTIVNKPTKDIVQVFLGGKRSETYKKDLDDGFDALTAAPLVESKFRLAHRYNKDCTLIKIARAEGDRFPSTQQDFSDRNSTS